MRPHLAAILALMTGPPADPLPGTPQTVVSSDPAIDDDRGVVRSIESVGEVRGLFGLQNKGRKDRFTFFAAQR
ncbi:hypothetical protein A8B78_06990 [Jannaschia sp. EhC01]|nr:hypothetical protein A8B78_06990 [Jannaschia sp. EhC01]